MQIEFIPESGVGDEPVRLRATQVVVYGDLGTPLALIASRDGEVEVHYAGQENEEFQAVLNRYRIRGSVVCEQVSVPRPAGRRLELG